MHSSDRKSTQQEIVLEIAVASLERALAAQNAGANRIELCDGLDVGGLTPPMDLVRQVREAVQIPIHVLVRPRPDNFVYTADEFSQMKSAISTLRGENIQGIVIGVLLPSGSVDIPRTRELVAMAAPLVVTFHRAFDETSDLSAALEDVILTGAHHILTSGGAPSASKGAPTLRGLIQQSAGRIAILPGGGLHPVNIAALVQAIGAREIHTGLGSVIPYDSTDMLLFESAIRDCRTSLREL